MNTTLKLLSFICFSLVIILPACSDDDEEPMDVTDKLEIGDFYEGGVIFYLDNTGEHGLVCAVLYQFTAGEWGCIGSIVVTDANGDVAIGTTALNTQHIEADCNTPGTAADLANNLMLNNFSDWFLPSKDELNQMYLTRAVINTKASTNGGDSFAEEDYWSSSQDGSIQAWTQSFLGGQQQSANKDNVLYVRSVRSF